MTTENLLVGFTLVLSGVLVIAISLPLLKDQIKPNALYGIRTAKAFESEENWYKMNRYGARQMILWSSIIVIVGLLSFFLPLEENQVLAAIVATSPALFILIAVYKIYRYSKTL